MTHGHRAKEKGMLINLPYGLNQAGMAPRVGKSGKSIRLYIQRVDQCGCICDYTPVTITRRVFITGDVGDLVLDNSIITGIPGWYASSNIGSVAPPPYTGFPAQNWLNSKHQPFYGIVFDKDIDVTELVDPASSDNLDLHYTAIGSPLSSTVGQSCFSIPSTDFKIINFSGKLGSWDKKITIGLGKAPTTTLPDGITATGTRVFSAQPPGATPHGPWGAPVGIGAPNTWCPVNEVASSLNPNNPDNTQANLSCQLANGMPTNDPRKDLNYAYYITNPAHFGGYTLLFNVVNPILSSYYGFDDPASWNFTSSAATSNPQRIFKSSSSNPSGTITFRGDMAAMTYLNNNITTRYVPTNTEPLNFSLLDTEICPNFTFTVKGPIAPFEIARNSAPIMELVTPTWSP